MEFGTLDWVVLTWFVATAASVLYVAWDSIFHNPEYAVMKVGWVLVVLYTGVFGLVLYILTCKEPRPGEHEAFVRPMWKQAIGSTVHCAAGDATGIIIAATVTGLLGLPMWLDMINEYVAGYIVGLFVFQALFMRSMMGGSYMKNLRESFVPETLSMNAIMAGMIPAMGILMTADMRAMYPQSPRFWFVMSVATIIGFVIAIPINWFLVSRGLKHGMGTNRATGPGAGVAPAERTA